MKIRYLSDLHIEFPWNTPNFIPSVGEDVVVLAGDVGIDQGGIEWAAHAFEGREVVYVLGNHEFYQREWESLVERARHHAFGRHVHVLENNTVDIAGVRFAGATLWTDFAFLGDDHVEASMGYARRSLADFRAIRGTDGNPLTPQATVDRHRASVAWLQDTTRCSPHPVVVVTHHSPSPTNEHPDFAGSPLSPCFHSRRDDLFQRPIRAWISGHTHHSSQETVNGIPLVSNQRGYPREGCSFSWDAVIHV